MNDSELESLYKQVASDSHLAALRAIFNAGAASTPQAGEAVAAESLAPSGAALSEHTTLEEKASELLHAVENVLHIDG